MGADNKNKPGANPEDAPPPPPKTIPNGLKFVFGGIAGMAGVCVVHPLDLIKTRMQLHRGKASSCAITCGILQRQGFLALYSGLSAGLLRQATYTTTRMGVYHNVFDWYKERKGATPGFGTKTMMGVAAGAVGAFVGTPADVALIRMTADGRLPEERRRNYKNVIDALTRISREEGVTKMWRGASPTIMRAMVVNAAQLGTYSQAREMFTSVVPEGVGLHFCASMVSGLITTIASLPIDIIKTRIQNAAKGQSQSSLVCQLVRNEGILSLWKGFLPYYAKLGPHTVLIFIFLEQLNAAYLKYS